MILKSLLTIVMSAAITGGSLGVVNIPDDQTAGNQTGTITEYGVGADPDSIPVSKCGKSLDEMRSKSGFRILTPKVLPQGYSLRGTDDGTPGRLVLKYADVNLCDGAKNLGDGVIEIVIAFSPSRDNYAMNGETFIDSYAKKYARNHLQYSSFVTKNNLYVIGADSGQSADNGKMVGIDPVRVYVLDESGKSVYIIRAFLPFERVLEIAESLS
jgi:hypothetical protein